MSELRPIRKLMVANRGEIAIRVMRAAGELGLRPVAIYAEEDRLSLHRFKADEAYLVGKGKKPVEAYLDIEGIIRVARKAGVDAIHPGYGFLSENPEFAEACAAAGILFIGPSPEIMRRLGNKVTAREVAIAAGVPVVPATGPLPADESEMRRLAANVGYPVMLKAIWGGGGRGMRVIEHEDDLAHQVAAAKREAKAAFGKDEVYLEKLVRRARHVEVQILGDLHGNLVHLFERDCSVQRRHQKVVERAPAPYLNETERAALCEAALKLGRAVGYQNAGTVEFLQDADTGAFYFIEVNPRIQVEHTVTEAVTGLDIVKSQIRVAQGAKIGAVASGVPSQADIHLKGHALQCRVTTEDPRNNFIPDYGHIVAYRSPAGPGIRLDGGTAYSGAFITRHFDSLLVKVTAWGASESEALNRMRRALLEFRVRGVEPNLLFLEALINHPAFAAGAYTTRFIDETPELFHFPKRRDRATRLLRFIGDVIVNGNPEVKGRAIPKHLYAPEPLEVRDGTPPKGTKNILDELGPDKFADWMKRQDRVLITDTTLRDAHQSLIATRMRSFDMLAAAPFYAHKLPQLFSLECWGGATFDVAYRFLKEDPWARLAGLREATPNILLQMLLRASNAVGYTNYPDNVVKFFVQEATDAGIDVFRIFDSLNWVENMRVAIDAVRDTGKLCEAAICYTGDLLDPNRPKYDLKYYVSLAKELEAAGAHILGIKDMAGLCKPEAARCLVKALKEEISLPIHFHTHDTSGIAAASVLAAVEAGAEAVDAAIDAMSGLTSQPNLGSIVEALRHTPKDSGLDPDAIREFSIFWEKTREQYVAFESDIRAGASEVYLHEMPGGQYTNLREQARALGIEQRWHDVAKAYAAVNHMFGDIVKVTPSSKVVGDMALMMVTSGLTEDDVMNPDTEIAFPESVVAMFRGDLGQPPGGWPAALQKKILKGEAPLDCRPGAVMEEADLEASRRELAGKIGRKPTSRDLAGYLMYPKVFTDYAAHDSAFGDVSVLPTPVFFYGMAPGDEITLALEPGHEIIIRFLAASDTDEAGLRSVFFELNGQPRSVKVADKSRTAVRPAARKAEAGNPAHLGAPMPGLVTGLSVKVGDKVERGDTLMTLEAMKMETAIRADHDGRVTEIYIHVGSQVDAKDLLIVVEPT
ncbi:MAG: pyruvate carboxylase [Sphingomonadales bacterium]|nr:pyruvate carboxylase [Sphingomonadales bacterium]